ncbi:hypothetical protein GcM1_155001 [Golovinomyces cichoracearum]|uniref:Uncharacterized protein n=1 Tax=Golovinomyces cichoracearum TaxID=62708 RepID=A0A420JA61_9PEZI|nr:hypothetical protein GcM1_155001 [Golovinomyces cichoracearum]
MLVKVYYTWAACRSGDRRRESGSLSRRIDRLSVCEFIELGSEVVDEEDQDISSSVIERYSTDRAGMVEEAEEEDFETEKVSNYETLKAIDIVRLWEFQQEDGQTTILQVLDNIEKIMQ